VRAQAAFLAVGRGGRTRLTRPLLSARSRIRNAGVVRALVRVALLITVLVTACENSTKPPAAPRDYLRNGPTASALPDQCSLPVSKRSGGWLCPTQNGGQLVPPDSQSPAAGICATASEPLAVVEANPDTPAPRCFVVQANQRLEVVNTSNRFGQRGAEITVSMPGFAPRKVAVGARTVFDRPFGEYLQPGVHDLRISLYAGGGAAIWLK
jgi:hypothetical protein